MTEEAPVAKAPRKPRAPRTRRARSAAPVASVASVTLAYTLTVEGTEYAPDTTVELPARVALDLVRRGRARWADNKEE